jgi:hypothetical protein
MARIPDHPHNQPTTQTVGSPARYTGKQDQTAQQKDAIRLQVGAKRI